MFWTKSKKSLPSNHHDVFHCFLFKLILPDLNSSRPKTTHQQVTTLTNTAHQLSLLIIMQIVYLHQLQRLIKNHNLTISSSYHNVVFLQTNTVRKPITNWNNSTLFTDSGAYVQHLLRILLDFFNVSTVDCSGWLKLIVFNWLKWEFLNCGIMRRDINEILGYHYPTNESSRCCFNFKHFR